VLDLDDTLILSDWRRERGWRVFKRPGADDFLKHMVGLYKLNAVYP
jgi:import inner membrane translocase subunit TIM50